VAVKKERKKGRDYYCRVRQLKEKTLFSRAYILFIFVDYSVNGSSERKLISSSREEI
jgi:hypothetical protein